MSTATLQRSSDHVAPMDGLFVVASAPAGWYEVADGYRRRWFDGRDWTDHYAPILETSAIDEFPERVHFSTGHGFHAIMTVMTLGMWAPVWATVAACNLIRSTAPRPLV